jgi:hypothetical protein
MFNALLVTARATDRDDANAMAALEAQQATFTQSVEGKQLSV